MAESTLLRLALAGAALWAGGAVAQDAPAPEPPPAGAGAVMLGPISVTATSNPIAAFDYPGMVTVIDRETIDDRQPSTPDDILRYVPNVEFVGGPRRSGEVPSIRGFSGPDVVVLFDGARQNFGSAHDGRFFIDPSLLTGVEVLRGPASSLYGSGGTGGVIEFRTLRASDLLAPGETAGIRFGGGFQSANEEWAGNFTAFARPIDGLDLLGSFTLRDSGDIRLGDGSTLRDSDDRIRSGLAKAGYDFGGGHRVEASYLRFRNDAEEPNNPQGAGSDGAVEKDIRSDTWRLSYEFADPADSLLDLNATAYYADSAADELRLDNLGNGPAGELLTRRVETLGLRVDNRSRLMLGEDAGLTLTYGVESYRDEQKGEAGGRPRDGVPAAEAETHGLFVQGEFAFDRPLGAPGRALLIPGVRYDHYRLQSDLAAEATKEDELSPRIGLSYLPMDWLLLFGNYAHAFRAPTFDELYLTGTHFRIPIGPGITNRFVPNPDLKPQTTDTIEVGAGLQFKDVVERGDGFRVKGTWFWIDGRDFIDLAVNQPTPFVDCNPFIPGACDGTTTSTNVPRAKLEGAEIEASYEIGRFRLGLGYSHLDGENADTGAPLGVLTPDQYIVDASVRLPEIDGVLGWRSIFAERFTDTDDPAEARDGYDVHDIYFVWQPSQELLRGLRIDLGIDNLFDENYARVFTDAPEPGRNFKIAARYTLTW